MLCYRCGSHVADTADSCTTCGQKLAGGGLRQATGTFSRRRANSGILEGAPYRPQDLVANRYLVKDTVGSGPLGHVFRAHDKEIDVEVALKVINPKLLQTPDERKQFSKIVKLARKLSHPNLVRVYEDGEDRDRPFFTSQFLDGLTLRKIIDLRLQKGQFFALHEIEPILAQVCAALDGAHKVGPHSDIKPDNVLVLPDLLKVTDWGLGLALPRLPFVQAMKARRSDRYLAPEFVEGGEIDGRADTYSMGIILGEMLSGLTPDGAIPELHRRNPDVPQAVEGFYRKSVNANPLARFKTAHEFGAELSALVKKHSRPPPPLPKVETASGINPVPRPRTASGMLQLSPRREKPPPPVPELAPPPPPPVSADNPMPVDATQKVDPEMLQVALDTANGPVEANGREETDVIDSGQFIASLDEDDTRDTRAMVDTVPPPPDAVEPVSPPRTWLWVMLLVVLGVGVGAGGGYVLLQKQKAAAQSRHDGDGKVDVPPAQPPEDAVVVVSPPPEDPAAKEKAAAEKAAAEKAAAEKAAADKAAADKAAADEKAATAQKSADDKAAAKQAAADRAAERAERLAAERAAREQAAKEKAERLAAEKAAREKAAQEKADAVKVAAVTKPKAGGTSCPDGMRLVTAGSFKMGTPRNDPMMGFDEKPIGAVSVESYCIDSYEYPNKRGVSPTVAITFDDAKRLCEGRGKRLCSESEWEKSCKGPGGARWPYGNSFDSDTCNTEDDIGDSRSLAPSGRFVKCRSGYGVADLSGNAAEWTAERIIKGGSFASADYSVRCSARKKGSTLNKSSEVGFRCCADPE